MPDIQLIKISPKSPDQYIQEIAKLHAEQLSVGLLTKMGINFLKKLYFFVASDSSAVLMVAIKNTRIVGFVCGAYDVDRFYKRFLFRYGYFVLWRLLVLLLARPKIFFQTYNLKKYFLLNLSASNLPKAELLSMVVKPDHLRQGIGRKLFIGLSKDFVEHNICAFKVAASETQKEAVCFYPSMGGRKIATTVLGQLKTSIYLINLQNSDFNHD
ncbi:MAG: Acetyltransferase [uncultured bacterium]|nr:MAG: Acetyltransferase [uncultured bacterium]